MERVRVENILEYTCEVTSDRRQRPKPTMFLFRVPIGTFFIPLGTSYVSAVDFSLMDDPHLFHYKKKYIYCKRWMLPALFV